jgi:hypothetical protein
MEADAMTGLYILATLTTWAALAAFVATIRVTQ